MKALVTGGAGFIGHHLVGALLARGDTVRVLDNFSTGKRENLVPFQHNFDMVEGDLHCVDAICQAAKGMEVIFHQAALASVPWSIEYPITTHDVNVTGTLNVLNAAREVGVRRVVFASSASIYGNNGVLPKHEEMVPEPLSPYAATKLVGEIYCQTFARVYGQETVCLRYFNVFGPGQDTASPYAAAIPIFIRAFLEKQKITVYGNGEQSRDFIYVDDVVQANLLAAEVQDISGKIFNVARGEKTSLNQMLDHLRAITGIDVEVEYTSPRRGDLLHSQADIGKAREYLRYVPTVDVEQGLKNIVEFGLCENKQGQNDVIIN